MIGAAAPGATIYTDEAKAYSGLPYEHGTVKHSVGEYVNGQASTNGLESFWSMLKRGYHGTYHKISPKHLQRYVNEFSGRHGVREMDTIDQMQLRRDNKRLTEEVEVLRKALGFFRSMGVLKT